MIPEQLITTYLEMTDSRQFCPAYLPDIKPLKIIRMDFVDLEFYRFLYSSVGKEWRWRDRLRLSDYELLKVLTTPETNVDVLYIQGTPAGYIELAKTGESTEIAYFGLRAGYWGKGLGKHLLSYGIETAWHQGAKRLWVHTCNLDSPYALENYLKRGFKVYKIEEQPMPAGYL